MMKVGAWATRISIVLIISLLFPQAIAIARENNLPLLPPPEDIPDEILRGEIVTEARSPIDGQPLSAKEYAELQTQLATSSFGPDLAAKIKHNIFMLRVLKLINTINPL
jgi:hypothetical protein